MNCSWWLIEAEKKKDEWDGDIIKDIMYIYWMGNHCWCVWEERTLAKLWFMIIWGRLIQTLGRASAQSIANFRHYYYANHAPTEMNTITFVKAAFLAIDRLFRSLTSSTKHQPPLADIAAVHLIVKVEKTTEILTFNSRVGSGGKGRSRGTEWS